MSDKYIYYCHSINIHKKLKLGKCRVCLTLSYLTLIVITYKHERKEMNTGDTRFNVEPNMGKTTNVIS